MVNSKIVNEVVKFAYYSLLLVIASCLLASCDSNITNMGQSIRPEGDQIKVATDAEGWTVVSGTQYNDEYQQFEDAKRAPYARLRAIVDSVYADRANPVLPADVLEFLARDSGTDVRTLEGRLTKVVFASKLHEQPVTMELAMTALREAVSEEHETVTADKIIGSICSFYKISRENLLGKSKKKELVQPRQICAYLMCEIMNIPLVSIGEALGGRDHTTVIHSREKITNLIKVNDRIAKEVEDIRNMILKQ